MKEEERIRRLSQDIDELRNHWQLRVDPSLTYLVLEDLILGAPFFPPETDLVVFIPPFFPLLPLSRFALPEGVRKGGGRISTNQPFQGWVIVELPSEGADEGPYSLSEFLRRVFLYLDQL